MLVGDGDRVQDEAWPELVDANMRRGCDMNDSESRVASKPFDDTNIATCPWPTCRPSWPSLWCRPSTEILLCSTGSCCPSPSSWPVSYCPTCTNTQLTASSDPHWHLATLPFDPSTVRPQAATHQSSAPTAFAHARCQPPQQLPATLPVLVRCSQGIHGSSLQGWFLPRRARDAWSAQG